ncbi:MAG: helix-turn-helix transcriptional regulator [Gammaproteobacteria bacterium]|jgi:transcriptional regulator with XRE-family HTH domain|nr:helix-turn-helix transcriptional regulator [Gammaproteobacteria bacterium]
MELDESRISDIFLGTRIQNSRLALGFTEAQLARRIGVKKTTLINWESGKTAPRANRLAEMAGILNVPLMWLIAGAESPSEASLEPNNNETLALEQKLDTADQLINQLSALVADLRGHTRRVQREIDDIY